VTGTSVGRASSHRAPRHRAIQQQPNRGRSRPTQSPAPTDARTEATGLGPDHCGRARVRAEPPPRALRHSHRSQTSGPVTSRVHCTRPQPLPPARATQHRQDPKRNRSTQQGAFASRSAPPANSRPELLTREHGRDTFRIGLLRHVELQTPDMIEQATDVYRELRTSPVACHD
jgi:hypothetical protein